MKIENDPAMNLVAKIDVSNLHNKSKEITGATNISEFTNKVEKQMSEESNSNALKVSGIGNKIDAKG